MPGSPSLHARRLLVISPLLLTATFAGCTAIPADAAGTLDRVRDGEIRVGITHNPPWTDTSGPPAGSEVELVEQLAADLDADVVWTEASEALLAEALRQGELDLAIGGFTEDTPWTDKAAVTVPYVDAIDEFGQTKKHVFLTRLGENRLLTAVEGFLRAEGS
ncbi:transporter substrate-binding domain-containing protein [Microbacterium sp. zg-YB36]|uniref:transporter substrate-binding domain-containing protein n=1 Tax=Microbacterium sp. zg-YB36 TaxID=2969407 RepID=UPI00214C7C4B|nr:transporter substrate-binding domain-containing protein [Microbacterium sp. zg-YB36]MDL5351678.1 transporter substrate-binding domain-containing protein [Microbacterium sp. zg-YB36]